MTDLTEDERDYLEEQMRTRVRRFASEGLVTSELAEEYLLELEGYFEPDAYVGATDEQLLEDVRLYGKEKT